MSENPTTFDNKSRNMLFLFVAIVVAILAVAVIALTLLGPAVGNIFSNIVVVDEGWIRLLL
ncbi:MAG TPA: hypothetical protein VMT34_05850 [Aggregatilineales bacterium]|nr:hypothetical protein [Aggregatilineales bacterium]